ncbi:hypothetical protein MLD38_019614 [Melastoma candidum]|uniref:Uncharacterized protein n=1 Tax=Melastoma candidum TaxID=119954 RepID=A0ACB9QWN6_9MYRT|nr:hypothetical protein MLD38_019614 [Melastoma candidum]
MDSAPAKEGDAGVDLEAGVAGSREEVGLVWDSDSDVELQGRPSVVSSWVDQARKEEKRKKSSGKKASRPPRPPRAPSLDAADQKLMREIAEYAMLKRARMERMKALKKERNAKAGSGSSSGNAIALVFTVLFIFVVLFHGCSPGTKPSVSSFEGSPESAGFHDKDSLSSHYGPITLLSYDHGPSYGSTPSSTEQAVDERLPHQKLSKALQ